MGGDRQVERRVVGQLPTLMNGLESRGRVIVIGATNLPNNPNPALRPLVRFDSAIGIVIPGRKGRSGILPIYT